jgi:hypothetical protein
MCLNLQEATVLWRVSGNSDGNLDIVVLQHHQSKGGMKNIATKRLLRECLKVLFRARYNLFLEPVDSCRY